MDDTSSNDDGSVEPEGTFGDFDARVPFWLFWLIVISLFCACGWGILGRLCGWSDPSYPIKTVEERKKKRVALRLEAEARAIEARRLAYEAAWTSSGGSSSQLSRSVLQRLRTLIAHQLLSLLRLSLVWFSTNSCSMPNAPTSTTGWNANIAFSSGSGSGSTVDNSSGRSDLALAVLAALATLLLATNALSLSGLKFEQLEAADERGFAWAAAAGADTVELVSTGVVRGYLSALTLLAAAAVAAAGALVVPNAMPPVFSSLGAATTATPAVPTWVQVAGRQVVAFLVFASFVCGLVLTGLAAAAKASGEMPNWCAPRSATRATASFLDVFGFAGDPATFGGVPLSYVYNEESRATRPLSGSELSDPGNGGTGLGGEFTGSGRVVDAQGQLCFAVNTGATAFWRNALMRVAVPIALILVLLLVVASVLESYYAARAGEEKYDTGSNKLSQLSGVERRAANLNPTSAVSQLDKDAAAARLALWVSTAGGPGLAGFTEHHTLARSSSSSSQLTTNGSSMGGARAEVASPLTAAAASTEGAEHPSLLDHHNDRKLFARSSSTGALMSRGSTSSRRASPSPPPPERMPPLPPTATLSPLGEISTADATAAAAAGTVTGGTVTGGTVTGGEAGAASAAANSNTTVVLRASAPARSPPQEPPPVSPFKHAPIAAPVSSQAHATSLARSSPLPQAASASAAPTAAAVTTGGAVSPKPVSLAWGDPHKGSSRSGGGGSQSRSRLSKRFAAMAPPPSAPSTPPPPSARPTSTTATANSSAAPAAAPSAVPPFLASPVDRSAATYYAVRVAAGGKKSCRVAWTPPPADPRFFADTGGERRFSVVSKAPALLRVGKPEVLTCPAAAADPQRPKPLDVRFSVLGPDTAPAGGCVLEALAEVYEHRPGGGRAAVDLLEFTIQVMAGHET